MLRGSTTTAAPPAPILDTDAGSYHSQMPQIQHSGVYEQPNLTFGPYDETPSKPPTTTLLPASSIERNTPPSTTAQKQQHHHQRQQSVPSFSAKRSNVPSLSPWQGQNKRNPQGMPLTGDGRGGGGNSPGRLGGGGRRSGPSTPSRENEAYPYTYSPQRARTPVDTTPKSTTTTTAQSRLGFIASSVSAFTARMTSPTQTPSSATRTLDDELCDLDIEAALFPASAAATSPLSSPQSPHPLDSGNHGGGGGDAFSPAAYKNLQVNATGLLHRMQDAYRQRTVALREMQAEREAQSEEIEEMTLRTRNFKNQLEAMAAKAAEQESAMQALVAELQAERTARRQLQERELYLQKQQQKQEQYADMGNDYEGRGYGDIMDDAEDRGQQEQRDGGVRGGERKQLHQRWSNGTSKSDVLSITDTEYADSSAESESIFSRSRSPTATMDTESVVDVPYSSMTGPALLHPRVAAATSPSKLHQQQQQGKTSSQQQQGGGQQLTAFQRLVKGISSPARDENGNGRDGNGVDGCRNCKGRDASVAWDTVSLLRDENSALKQRVAALDVVIEGALDVVNGIGM